MTTATPWLKCPQCEVNVLRREFESPAGCPACHFVHDPEDPAPIVPDLLYLGSHAAASKSGERWLRKLNVGHILNCALELKQVLVTGFEYTQLLLEDNEDEDPTLQFPQAFEFIERAREAGSAVLVHCQAGASRSATVCIAYLMKYRDMTLQDAFTLCRRRRKRVAPNPHFMNALLGYEKLLRGTTSMDLTEYRSSWMQHVMELGRANGLVPRQRPTLADPPAPSSTPAAAAGGSGGTASIGARRIIDASNFDELFRNNRDADTLDVPKLDRIDGRYNSSGSSLSSSSHSTSNGDVAPSIPSSSGDRLSGDEWSDDD